MLILFFNHVVWCPQQEDASHQLSVCKTERLHLEDRIKRLEIIESVPEMDSETEVLTEVKLLKEDGEGVVSLVLFVTREAGCFREVAA